MRPSIDHRASDLDPRLTGGAALGRERRGGVADEGTRVESGAGGLTDVHQRAARVCTGFEEAVDCLDLAGAIREDGAASECGVVAKVAMLEDNTAVVDVDGTTTEGGCV